MNDDQGALEYGKRVERATSGEEMIAGSEAVASLSLELIFGLEPVSCIQGNIYDWKLRRAPRARSRIAVAACPVERVRPAGETEEGSRPLRP